MGILQVHVVMCGIAGIFIRKSNNVDMKQIEVDIERMTSTLYTRGPDSSGTFTHYPIAFGHRRLSIIDSGDSGSQPMVHSERGIVLTYNGEVYNFRDLRRELLGLGIKFNGTSDTEVVLNVYSTWGLMGLKRLEGMFALSIWDPAAKRLVLMRDRFGIKPLFYAESKHGLAFSSEIKGVVSAGGVDLSIDDQAFSEYLWYGSVFENRTFYTGVRSLEPGHWIIVDNDRQKHEAWWKIEEWLGEPPVVSSRCEAERLVLDALDSAVDRQLVADVPVGVFLSGGLDSSAIAASSVRALDRKFTSFSAGFSHESDSVSELPKARRVAKHLGLEHEEVYIEETKLSDVLITLAHAHDEPFADAANVPLYLMSKSVSDRVKVVLQGDGGDELFAGYRRYSLLRNENLWKYLPGSLSSLARYFGQRGHRFARIADALNNSDFGIKTGCLLTQETLNEHPASLFLPDRKCELLKSTNPFLVYQRAADRFKGFETVQRMLLTDLTTELPAIFLTKVDRATMAAGIEARVPMLDERLVRLVLNMPSEWKVSSKGNKLLLRDSQRMRLPSDILDAPKNGFGVPYQYWMKTGLYNFSRELMLDLGFLRKFSLDGKKIETMLKENRNGTSRRGFMLWKLLQLSIFWNISGKNLF